jgi:hypothetical protein
MAADTTEILSLPFIMPSQAQKHVTHNEALEKLDAIVQLHVLGAAAIPPATPKAGERWIVAQAPMGVFAGHSGEIAIFRNGAWVFVRPAAGWTLLNRATGRLIAFDGSDWIDLEPPASLSGVESVGVNATADEENRLAVASPSILFTHEGAGHRLKVNKAAEAETASLVFQSAYEGRAEMGLAGSDDFALKVSADGVGWHEAISVERATGRVRFPSGGAREMLAEPRTWYVGPAGDDANSGLSPGDAFATLQKAADAALALDAAGNAVTIQLADGTYAGAALSRPMFDGGTLLIRGNAAAPGNVLIDGGAGPALSVDAAGARAQVEGVKLAGQIGLWARYGAIVFLRGKVAFGPVSARHVGADNGAYVEIIATVEIAGGAQQHFFSNQNGHILMTGSTVTLTGAPAFSNAFAVAQYTGLVSAYGNSYSGAATGMRYRASGNGVIFVNAGGETVLPGDVAGVVTSGGQYL